MSKIISVADDFQFSVNIEYDLGNDEKLKNFVPTNAALNFFQEIFYSLNENSTNRARILIGAYGRGKSHIVLTALSLLMKKDLNLFEKLLPKLEKNPELHQLVKNFYTNSEKILPVIINGTATNLNQSFLSALQRTLTKFNLLDILPETNFQAAVKVLQRWQKDFPKTYAEFKDLIDEPMENFVDRLKNFDAEAYATFERIYPTLTAGSVFNPFSGFEIVELYESVAKSLRSKGYGGVFVVYDEFSKFLESNIGRTSVSDTKMLQDFAEKANRSGELQLHLLLISHKEISNYIDKLPKEKVDGWRGVSNRFFHLWMNEDFSQTYEIISEVIRHDPELWKNFLTRHAKNFNALKNFYSTSRMFSNVAENFSLVAEGCFPLHPVSTFILPRLSERIAQNERTLFTFLSADGIATLPAFLKDYRDNFALITPDKIYDYFEPIFRQELYAGEIHKIFLLAEKILSQIDSATLDAKIIKTIALIYMLEQFELLAPTKEQLAEIFSCDFTTEEITNAFDELTEKNFVIYLRQSNNYLKLKQHSGVNIMQKISNATENISVNFSMQNILNAENFENVFYPSRYNIEHDMTRWFDFKFISSEEIFSDKNFETEIEGDGIIFAVLVESEIEIDELKKILLSASKKIPRSIFILPKKFVDVREVVKKFSAVKNLKELAENDAVLFDEFEIIFEDLRAVLKNFIESYIQPENFQAIYIHGGKILKIYRKANLSEIMSKICDKIFSRTPIINNEVINKNEITNVALNSRSKIISALLRSELEKNLGFRGASQDISIMRSSLIRTGILIGGENPEINLRPADKNFCYLLETIENFILSTRKNPTKFSVLYEKLISPSGQIGLRRGVIPIYIAAVFHKYKQKITITNNFGAVKINSDILTQINSAPENFLLEYLDWSAENKKFAENLAEIFADFVIDAEKNSGDFDFVANAMMRWFLSLPKYAKEFNFLPSGEKISAENIKLRNVLRQNFSGADLIFKKLPEIFAGDLTAEKILASKKFFDSTVDELENFLLIESKKIFKAEGNFLIKLREWCGSFDAEIFEQLFADETEKFLRLIKTSADEKIFIAEVGKLATGLNVGDWSERTAEIYFEKLKQFKNTAENFQRNETADSEIIFVGSSGEKIIKRFENVELSPRGKLLFNQITNSVESMGQSISIQEKRQILIEILQKIC